MLRYLLFYALFLVFIIFFFRERIVGLKVLVLVKC